MAMCQEHSRRDGREREKNEMFRPQATSPDQRGAEAFLKNSGKEFNRQRENVFGIKYPNLSVLLMFSYAHLQTVKEACFEVEDKRKNITVAYKLVKRAEVPPEERPLNSIK